VYHAWYFLDGAYAVSIKKLPAAFYASRRGNEPVREWLKGLDNDVRKIIGQDISDAEYGWPVGMPLCRSLGHGLFEVRSNISGGRIARLIFAPTRSHMILLHGFIKKTQKTPKRDLDLALKRKKEIENG